MQGSSKVLHFFLNVTFAMSYINIDFAGVNYKLWSTEVRVQLANLL
jgi:hypothetical protein